MQIGDLPYSDPGGLDARSGPHCLLWLARQHLGGRLKSLAWGLLHQCGIAGLPIAGQPLMDDRTRYLITANSHGLPLYLDLAVMRFLDLYRRHDRAPAPGEFNLDFPALVARTFRDLTPDVRRVLRAVSLLDSFSVELATAAAGLDHDARAPLELRRPPRDH
ncbi:hypothetical protein [Streptomyces atratus]|uniref:hypothetical protein n=1 Tax=Streptomyces atratus TaxID=1893 RepID=UPI0033CE83AD